MVTPRNRPVEAAAGAPFSFGTSGWRGIAGADFTPARVRVVTRAVARWLAETSPGGEVIVAHDTRPDGAHFADIAGAELAARGAFVVRARSPIPTPVVTRAVMRRGSAAAVVFTASHNPPEYRGMKLFGPAGTSLDRAATDRIEALAAACGDAGPPDGGLAADEPVDLVGPYLCDLLEALDLAAFRRRSLRVVYDAMHGAGGGVLDRALGECGVATQVLRGEPSRDFGGASPDPRPDRLGVLRRALAVVETPALGLATDGDADRFAVITSRGRILTETEAVAMLVDYLASRGRLESGIAISYATGSLVERVARSHGLRVERCPIGFGHLSRVLASGRAEVAGEESGGFALGRFGRDKDGILAGCLFAEMVSALPVSLEGRLSEFERLHGRSCCGRTAVPTDDASRLALHRLLAAPPAGVDGAPVRRATPEGGLHLALDDGFVMLRASGTEPLLRIYAEATSPRRLERRLAAAKALVAAPAGGSAGRLDVSQGSR